MVQSAGFVFNDSAFVMLMSPCFLFFFFFFSFFYIVLKPRVE